MAIQFGERYAKLPWNAIYASPLVRTQETAEPLRAILKSNLLLRDGLKEIDYGKWEGKSVAEVEKEYHDDHLRWSADPAWNAPTGGERATSVSGRAMGVIEEINESHKSGNILVVSHKATIRIIICSLLGVYIGRFRERIGCPVASVSLVEFAALGPLVHTLADRSHLSDSLRELPGT